MKTTANAKAGNSSRSESVTSRKSDKTNLMKLFENELKDIYWAEKALIKALPKMIKNASSGELSEALADHLGETEEHLERLEEVFSLLEKKAVAKKCDAMEGLIKEGQSIMEDCEEGAMCDAGIISASQKIEHYEIASYGTLRTFANTLGLTEIAELLQRTLDEEKAADLKLTEVAVSFINFQADEEESE